MDLVYLTALRQACLLASDDATRLSAWHEFDTLADHAQRWQREDPVATPLARLCARLDALAARGTLLDRAALLQCAPPPHIPEFTSGIEWLAIPTRGRAPALRRALRSYVASLERFGRRESVLVMGDDETPGEAAATERAAASVDHAGGLVYAGRRERQAFADALCAGGALPSDLVSFALLGAGCGAAPTIGAARNCILLATAGARVLSVDDDTVCRVARAPGSDDGRGLVLSGRDDVTEFWFHARRREALAAVGACDLDPLGGHARVLGAPLGEVVRLFDVSRVECRDAPSGLLHGLLTGRGRLRLTFNGVVGDCGMHSGAALRVHPGAGTRQRLVRRERDFDLALASREVVRQAPATSLAGCRQTVAMFLGLDNRGLLPPFLPAYRNEDGLFGLTLERCFEGAASAHLPWVLLHAPAGARAYDAAGLGRIRVADVLALSIASWTGALPSQPPSRRLALLGRHLQELASLPSADFKSLLAGRLVERAFELIARREGLLVRHAGHPLHWAADVRAQVDSLRRAVTDPAYLVPLDLAGRVPPADVPRALQALLHAFGETLALWPAMVERAGELRARGSTLGRSPR